MAARIPGKEEFDETLRYFTRRLDVTCDHVTTGLQAVRRLPGVRSATVFGQSMHLLVEETLDEQSLRAELARAGANVTGFWGQAMFLARRYPLGAVGFVIVLIFVLTAALADVIAPADPTATNAKFSLARPGGVFWLGADFMGRDMYSRVVHGARISLAVGAGATAGIATTGLSLQRSTGAVGDAAVFYAVSPRSSTGLFLNAELDKASDDNERKDNGLKPKERMLPRDDPRGLNMSLFGDDAWRPLGTAPRGDR